MFCSWYEMSLSLRYQKLVKVGLKLQERHESLPQRRKQEGAGALIVGGWAELWDHMEASQGFTARGFMWDKGALTNLTNKFRFSGQQIKGQS